MKKLMAKHWGPMLAVTLPLYLPPLVKAEDVVLPCPEGELDSTAAITDGLRDTRDGGTLYLEPCTYYLASAVEARWNHHGTIQGKGKERTFIKVLPGAKIDGVPITAWETAPKPNGAGNSWSTLFLFENPESGDITISDLSIVVTDPEPAGEQDDDDWWKGSLYNMIVITGPEVDTRFERSSFRGASGNFAGYNVAHVSHVFNSPGRLRGDHTVIDCDFSNAAVTLNPAIFLAGKITIANNTFENSLYGPMIEDCSNCIVEISGNTIRDVKETGIGLIATGNFSLEPSAYLVEKNSIYLGDLPADSGVVVSEKLSDSEINTRDNKIVTTHDGS